MQLKIAIVNPPRFNGIPVIREERCEITERYSVLEPYSLLQISSILRDNGNDVVLLDCNGFDYDTTTLRRWLESQSYDLLLFRFTPTTFENDTWTASLSKKVKPSARTAGICWTLQDIPVEVMKSCPNLDVYLRHEYEVVAGRLVDALENGGSLDSVEGISYRDSGKIHNNPDAEPIDDYDSLPMPAYDLLKNLDPYFINTPSGKVFSIIYTSKGCPYNCIFCTVANTKWRARSAESVLEEIQFLKREYGIQTVSFFDETFTIDKNRVLQISGALKELDIEWFCNTRVHLVTLAMLKEMREGGCRGISFGVESGSQKILDGACKGATVGQAEKAIQWSRQAGIKSNCSFIFGLPGENWTTVEETIDFVGRTLPTGAQFNVAVPYPGTKLSQIAKENGWFETDDWKSLYQHESVMRTEEMSSSELNEARELAYRSLYSNPKWYMRNLGHVMRHPEDLALATRYFLRILDNFVIHRMKHAH
ncbi:MAG: radical SAM protein [Thermoplasmata archaeon]|nr:radical SAM protein [Thermoplasmata archaeon]